MKHPLIPANLLPDQIENWLKSQSKEAFVDEQKVVFSEDQLNDFARDSSRKGGEILDLDLKLKQAADAIKKGTSEMVIITIPATAGMNQLAGERADLDTKCKTGYELVKRQIYGLVDADNEIMIYFDAAGNEAEDRRRPLSAKEKHQYVGLFLNASNL